MRTDRHGESNRHFSPLTRPHLKSVKVKIQSLDDYIIIIIIIIEIYLIKILTEIDYSKLFISFRLSVHANSSPFPPTNLCTNISIYIYIYWL
jgi:hypothetical protein